MNAMSILEILYTILIMPLQIMFEAIYNIAYSVIGNPGLTIVVFSLAINFLVLPLYRRADAMQEEERDIEQKLHKGVQHIKKTFRGDEQMLMLQTYYRQNHYKPTYVLRGAMPLFLEIPFFIAAYRFLSNLKLLQGVAFGPISDLGQPDSMLMVAGFSINLLPIVMTAVNLVSSYLFTRGYPLKTKVQLFGMALFFLVFLYNSPAGLVFYWTLNNVFSLIKTIFYKLKNPRMILSIMAALTGVVLFILGLTKGSSETIKWKLFACMVGVILELPLFGMLRKRQNADGGKCDKTYASHPKIFVTGGIFLAVLTGLIIPSAVIAASPQEFIVRGYLPNPIWYIVSSCCLSIGTCVVWLGVFYSLMDERFRTYFEKLIWILSGISIVDYMFFGKNLGIISNSLQYESGMYFTHKQELINVLILALVAAAMWFIYRLIGTHAFDVLAVGTLALCGLALVNIHGINTSIAQVDTSSADTNGTLCSLSKNGKNVVVLMLDRGISEYIPYIMQEKPELKKQFDGFTFYSNTISFGEFTNFGTPGLYGGYEYTPVENNKRANETLASKQNEALKVMPVLFSQNGYDVTVCDPTYANYTWIPDLSIYDEYPNIKTYNTLGAYSDVAETEGLVKSNKRNFFAFSLTKIAPLFAQPTLYEDGRYNYSTQDDMQVATTQTTDGILKSNGINASFQNAYNVLCNLPMITDVADDSRNTFLMMSNDTTHEPNMLQLPDYTVSATVDNTNYSEQFEDDYIIDNQKLKMDNDYQVTHYQVNMAAMIQLGKWFDYLRKNDVYDNTRIIIVSDHGRDIKQMDEAIFNIDGNEELDSEFFRALLMVKDFDAKGFTISDEFMTNADTPTLAVHDLIKNPVNPFTNKMIDNTEKTAHDQFILESSDWSVDENNGNTFLPGNWYAVHGDTWDPNNWKLVARDAVLSNIVE